MNLHAIQRGSTSSTNTILLLHGFGSNEHDLMGLAPELKVDVNFICLRAPLNLGFGSYAWYMIEFDALGQRSYSKQESLAARDLVVDALSEIRKSSDRLILGGFSQGAILSLGAALKAPELVDGLILWSGATNDEFLPEQATETFRSIPILVQHGTLDPILPITEGRKTRDTLASLGANFEYQEFPIPHTIGLENIKQTRLFLSRLLDAQ